MDKYDDKYHYVSHSTVEYSTVQYSTVQYSTVQYSTVRQGGRVPAVEPFQEID